MTVAGGTTTLPQSLIELLAEMYGELNPATGRRWDQRALAAFCALPPWNITTTHAAVGRAIRPLRELRAELTRDILRERLNAQLSTQIEGLDDLITKVVAKAREATPMVQRKGLDSVVKALNVKLRYSGVAARFEVDGELDVKSDGKPLRIYLPAEQPFDDEPAPEAQEAG